MSRLHNQKHNIEFLPKSFVVSTTRKLFWLPHEASESYVFCVFTFIHCDISAACQADQLSINFEFSPIPEIYSR